MTIRTNPQSHVNGNEELHCEILYKENAVCRKSRGRERQSIPDGSSMNTSGLHMILAEGYQWVKFKAEVFVLRQLKNDQTKL